MIGQVLNGAYQLTELVGSGGYADVYRARDLRSGQDVAVKLLHPHIARIPGVVARFEREVTLARRLQTPAVARILDTGRDPAAPPYMVMELIEGQTVAHLVEQRSPLPVPFAVEIVDGLLGALKQAHALGIVHRDIKPQNLMLDTVGRVRVLDFGVARAAGVGTITADGQLLGTPEYMAPEQLDGRPIDARADLYAAGAVLYHLLAGRPPYLRTNGSDLWEIVRRVRRELPPPLQQLRPQLPPTLVEIVERAMAREPTQRYQTAFEMQVALAVAAGVDPPTPPPFRSPLAGAPAPTDPAPLPSSPSPSPAGPPPPPPGSAPSPPARRDVDHERPTVILPALPRTSSPGAPPQSSTLLPQPDGVPSPPHAFGDQPTRIVPRPPSPADLTLPAGASRSAPTPPAPTPTAPTPSTPAPTPPSPSLPHPSPASAPQQPPSPPQPSPPQRPLPSASPPIPPSYPGPGPAAAPTVSYQQPAPSPSAPSAPSTQTAGRRRGRPVWVWALGGAVAFGLIGAVLAFGWFASSPLRRAVATPTAVTTAAVQIGPTRTPTVAAPTAAAPGPAAPGPAVTAPAATASPPAVAVAPPKPPAPKPAATPAQIAATPAPPPASAPQPQSPPPAAGPPPGSAIIVADTFDRSEGGLLTRVSPRPEDYTFSYERGEYAIKKLNPALPAAPIVFVRGEHADTVVAVDVRLVGEAGARYAFLVCRDRSSGGQTRQYRASIVPEGRRVILSHWQDGNQRVLAETRDNPAVLFGNAMNRLELRCVGPKIEAIVNGTTVVSAEEGTLASGEHGLGAGTFSGVEGTLEARFDNLEIRTP